MSRIPVIHSTTSYEKFGKFASNRDVKSAHLKNLIDSIRRKNLLHLFPIVVNSDFEIVDGQHRLASARALQVPIYYIVDSSVTQADIAMVNNNRKGWTAKDYIKFHYEEGVPAYKSLKYLLDKYPLTIIGAVRLMSATTAGASQYFGGGKQSLNLKLGTINDENFEMAKMVCEVTKVLRDTEKVKYAFRPDMVLEIKYCVVKHNLSKKECMKKISGKGHLFPKESLYGDFIPSRLIRELLFVAPKIGHTKEEVNRILRLS